MVEIGDEFEPEFDALHEDVRTESLALSRLLQQFGSQLGRSCWWWVIKSGGGEKRFYRELIRRADDRFDAHLARLTKGEK